MLGQICCLGFGPPRLASRDFDDAPFWPEQVRQLSRIAPPDLDASAALLVDLATQIRLYDKGADQRRAPASTTKMMTALVALARSDLSESVVVQASDLTVGSFIGLSAGETWKLEDLLYALLLPSDNAAAVVIARHVAGSERAFVDLMNAKAAEWGLQGTHFANPHGFDDPQHYSTAADLAEIARRGLMHPVFAQIVGTSERRVGGRTLRNLNQLLGTYEGAEGVKTGTTDAAGECLVSAVMRPDGRAICVVLGSRDRYRDSRLLLDYYFANYRTVPLSAGPPGLNRVRTLDGNVAVMALREQRMVLLQRWQVPWLRVWRGNQAADRLTVGEAGGVAQFSLGSVPLAQVPLYVAAP